jgi:hypothetical protein
MRQMQRSGEVEKNVGGGGSFAQGLGIFAHEWCQFRQRVRGCDNCKLSKDNLLRVSEACLMTSSAVEEG